MRLAVDGHRLDAGGRLSRCSRIAHGEGVRAGLSIEGILDGVAFTVRQSFHNRGFRVPLKHMIAHSAELLLIAPDAGSVFGVLFGHFRHRVTRLTFHIPACPDMARLPVDPAEVVLPVAGVVDQLQFHRVDRPAVVPHIRKRQQLHVDAPVLVGNQYIIEIPEEVELVVAVDGARLNLQLHQLSLGGAHLDGFIILLHRGVSD